MPVLKGFYNNFKDINLTPDDNLLLKLKNVANEKKYINTNNGYG